jgi:long-chain fatty acid transport protein
MLVAVVMLTSSGTVMATNGYFVHGVGTESKGMAGTGIGSNAANGPIIAASNPALAVFADDSWEVGLSIFSPLRSYKASASVANGNGGAFTIGEGDFDSSSEVFPIPYVAKNWRLGNGSVISTAFYGRGGMNTDWDNSDASATSLACDPFGQAVATGPGPFCAGVAGVDLSQAFLSITYAGKVSDRFAWGIGPIFAVQLFEAKGVGSFAGFTNTFAASGGTVFPTALSDNGHDISTGLGATVGLWFSFSDAVSAGFSHQSKLSMSEFDDYADLFAEDGGFDIPASTKLGLSIIGSNNARLNLDIEHTEFSDVDSVGNPLANVGSCPTAGLGRTDLESCLGGSNGAGFGWDDMTTYKVGVEWTAGEMSTWRAGLSYGEQPIQEADVLFNILAPGVMEKHFTVGMTKRRPNGGAWTVSIMYAPEKTVEGLNLFDPTQTIELKMKQFEFEVSHLW